MKIFVLVLISGMLMSCGFVYKEKITGKFFLIATDSMKDLSVSYHIGDDVYLGIIPGGVYDVSLNDKYIIAKCYPYIDSIYSKLNYYVTECYIIEIINDEKFYDEKKCLGPFSEDQLMKEMNELNIDKLKKFYYKKH